MKTSVKAATVIGEPKSNHLSQSIIGRIKVQIVGLFLALATPAAAMEAPEGIVYCGGDPEQQIEFAIRPYTGEQWNVAMTIDGQRVRAMSSYSYFGRQKEPDGFVVILLAETGDDYMVFDANGEHWLEMEQTRFDQCN